MATLFGLGDIEAALQTPTGYPYMEIFVQATNSISGSTGMASILIVLAFATTVGFVATSSRMIWSFARDRGLPFSNLLSKVFQKFSKPLQKLNAYGYLRSSPTALPYSLSGCNHRDCVLAHSYQHRLLYRIRRRYLPLHYRLLRHLLCINSPSPLAPLRWGHPVPNHRPKLHRCRDLERRMATKVGPLPDTWHLGYYQ